MISKRSLPIPKTRISVPASCLILASLFAAGCDTTDPPPATPVDTTLQIITPANGGVFKIGQPFRMIVKSDYSKFSSGLNYQVSMDSAKTWQLMKSMVRKEGIALDTMDWDPVGDPPGDVPVGKPLLVRVIDYNKTHFTISKYITLEN